MRMYALTWDAPQSFAIRSVLKCEKTFEQARNWFLCLFRQTSEWGKARLSAAWKQKLVLVGRQHAEKKEIRALTMWMQRSYVLRECDADLGHDIL